MLKGYLLRNFYKIFILNKFINYVYGFVLVVKKDKLDEYRKRGSLAGNIWKKHGALQYFECVGDDLNPKMPGGMEDMENMKHRQFTEMTGAKSNEEVWFSFIVFKSRKHRDEVNKKVMEEMNEKYKDYKDMSMPFEINRMSYGGFSVKIEG